MIGKLIEIHVQDAYHIDSEFLIGTLWEIDKMGTGLPGYLQGLATLLSPRTGLTYTSNDATVGGISLGWMESSLFYAAKFEIVENIAEDK